MRKPLKIQLPWKPFGLSVFGDPHIDAPTHARDRLLRDLEAAKDRGDSILILGDVWSAILQGDRRRRTASHQEETDAEIDAKIDEAFELFKPYADNIEVIMVGNHEVAVLKYYRTDMVRQLIRRLNEVKEHGVFNTGHVQHGGYSCWLQIQFIMKNGETRLRSTSQKGFFHHGSGGASGAPVTKGLIDANRLKVAHWFDFAAIGHKHTHVHDRDRVSYLDDYGNILTKDRDFFSVGGYSGGEEEYEPMDFGYKVDFAEERFYHHEAQGYVRIMFRPHYERGHVPNTWIGRTIEQMEST